MSALAAQSASASSQAHEAIAAALLTWFSKSHRDLPWRHTRDPYRIWVSEVMLQQTQVITVGPYYERFLAHFPTVGALANAELDEVLAVWQGLGYYSRARNLHAAARVVRDCHGGQAPGEPAALRSLPGVGEYIAAAVLSIAFGHDIAAIDGNVKRVLCRLFDCAQDPDRAEGRRTLRGHAQALLPPGRAGDFNQGMMELGAIVCLPRGPLCHACPVSRFCQARAGGLQEERPLRRSRPPVPHRELVAAYVVRGERLLLLRRRPEGLLGGLWELPNLEIAASEGEAEAVQRLLQERLGVQAKVGEQLATVRHAYTHYTLTVRAYRCELRGEPQAKEPWDAARWVSIGEREALGLSGVTIKVLTRLPWPGERLF